MKNPILETLKILNYKIYVTHNRYSKVTGKLMPLKYFRDNKFLDNINPHGGLCQCEIVSKNEMQTPVFIGSAKCSMKDCYVKSIGLNKALGRCYSNLVHYLNTNAPKI